MNTTSEHQIVRTGCSDYGTPIPTQEVIDLDSVDSEQSKRRKTNSPIPFITREGGDIGPIDKQTPEHQEDTRPQPPTLKFQFLYKTIIEIECGPRMRKFPIHKELLCSTSEAINFLFENSKSKAREYRLADSLEQKLKKELETATADFNAGQVFKLLSSCFDLFPIKEYQADIKKTMMQKTDEIFGTAKYSKVALANGGLPKRANSTYPGEGINETLARIRCLKPDGIQKVAEVTYEHLLELKQGRADEAIGDRNAAAAQNRLVLAHYSPTVLQFFVTWLYKGPLVFQNASQLCELYGLAQELGITHLSEHCKQTITDALFRQISKFEFGALSGNSFEAAMSSTTQQQGPEIEIPEDPLLDVVYSMLASVLKVGQPPIVLRSLVVETLAFGGNVELIEKIAPKLPPAIVIGIVKALYERAEHAEAGFPRPSLGKVVQERHEDQFNFDRTTEEEGTYSPGSSTVTPVDLKRKREVSENPDMD